MGYEAPYVILSPFVGFASWSVYQGDILLFSVPSLANELMF